MKKKIQKLKTRKIENKSELYDLEEVFNLIGKKLHGDDWVFDNHSFKTDPDYMKYQSTLLVTHDLIENNFFDVIKSDGKKLKEGEQIILFTDHAVLNDYKIPKEQLDYVLKTRGRFRDRIEPELSRVLIYTACFGRETGRIVVPEFNSHKIHEIIKILTIKDFEYWLAKKDIKEEYLYYILLGINPEYYLDFLSQAERKEISSRKLLPIFKENSFQYQEIRSFIANLEKTSEVKWKKSWEKFIDELYRKGLFFDSSFSKHCHEFISYLKEKNQLPNYFDKYLNHEIFKPKFDKFLKIEKILSQQDVTLLAMGLEPRYAALYSYYRAKVTQANGYYSALKSDKKIFFYKSYDNYVQTNFINFFGHYNLIFNINYKGNLVNFLNNLLSHGFIFGRELRRWFLSVERKAHLDLPENNQAYHTLSLFGEMYYWSLGDLFALLSGISPLNQKQIIFFLGIEFSNSFFSMQKIKMNHLIQ